MSDEERPDDEPADAAEAEAAENEESLAETIQNWMTLPILSGRQPPIPTLYPEGHRQFMRMSDLQDPSHMEDIRASNPYLRDMGPPDDPMVQAIQERTRRVEDDMVRRVNDAVSDVAIALVIARWWMAQEGSADVDAMRYVDRAMDRFDGNQMWTMSHERRAQEQVNRYTTDIRDRNNRREEV